MKIQLPPLLQLGPGCCARYDNPEGSNGDSGGGDDGGASSSSSDDCCDRSGAPYFTSPAEMGEEFARTWVQSHADAAAQQLGKPVVLEVRRCRSTSA